MVFPLLISKVASVSVEVMYFASISGSSVLRDAHFRSAGGEFSSFVRSVNFLSKFRAKVFY